MPTKRSTTPAETYTAAQLPEVLRSKLVAGIVVSALDAAAKEMGTGEDYPQAFHAAASDVLTTTAQEIRDWHDQKPSPDHMNGGALPGRFGDPA
jgi:hypothetical protein